jgi:hypothetical protein
MQQTCRRAFWLREEPHTGPKVPPTEVSCSWEKRVKEALLTAGGLDSAQGNRETWEGGRPQHQHPGVCVRGAAALNSPPLP